MEKTKIAFRVFPEGDVIALMVDDSYQDGRGQTMITSYQRIGQHAGACPSLVKELKKATKKQYQSLKNELESLGYEIQIVK